MPKRNADEPAPQKTARSSTSPVDTKIPKIASTSNKSAEKPTPVSKTVSKAPSPAPAPVIKTTENKKRKRSLEDGEAQSDRQTKIDKSIKVKVEKADNEGGKSLARIQDEDNRSTGSSGSHQPDSVSPVAGTASRFVVNREDPVGLVALKGELYEILRTIPDEVDAQYVNDIRGISDEIMDDDTFSKKALMDTYIREFLMEVVLPTKQPWENLLKLSIIISKDGIVSPSLPISLLVDLIDLTGLEECEMIFKFIEDRLELWKDEHFFNSCKNAVLRMCNDMLRRLSQTQNTIFCGRILIFLSNYFPFSERSGLNVMSEFNLDNVTVYKTGDGSDDTEDTMDLVEEKEKLFEGMNISIPGLDEIVAQCQEQKKKNLTLDYNMYVKFWSLQDFLRNPVQCYNKVNWKTFALYTSDLLDAFKAAKLLPLPETSADQETDSPVESQAMEVEVSQTSTPGISQSVTTFDIPRVGDERVYFAKYLTNRRVLELEMSDPGFRRSLMVQLLIVLQYLTLPVKFKTEQHVLNEEQLEFVKKTTEKVYEILLDIKPGGKAFVETVKHILRREEYWNKWKNDGCPAIKKPVPPISVTTDPKYLKNVKLEKGEIEEESIDFEEPSTCVKPPVKPRPSLGMQLKNATLRKRFTLGNPELNRLWNICPDNLTACRSKKRDFMPSIESYFGEAMKELDPEPLTTYDPKREVKPKKILGNVNFGWRGLRLLARKSPYFFQMVSGTPIHPLQSYLEFVLKKIATDMELTGTISTEDVPKIKIESTGPGYSQPGTSNGANEEAEMVTATEDDEEELPRPEGSEDMKDDEDGEVKPDIRNLTEEEQQKLGKSLGSDWKKLAIKLGFKKDEIDFFETEQKDNAGTFMLKMWTEQEQEDATIADLLYILGGLGLQSKAEGIIAIA